MIKSTVNIKNTIKGLKKRIPMRIILKTIKNNKDYIRSKINIQIKLITKIN
jgi:hypothetical protein